MLLEIGFMVSKEDVMPSLSLSASYGSECSSQILLQQLACLPDVMFPPMKVNGLNHLIL